MDRAEPGIQGQGHVSSGPRQRGSGPRQRVRSVCWAMRIQDHGQVWAVDRDGTGESCIVGYLLEPKTRGDATAARPALSASQEQGSEAREYGEASQGSRSETRSGLGIGVGLERVGAEARSLSH